MKQLLKYTLYLGLTISLIFLTAGILISVFFSESIEHTVVNNIKENINSELSIANVDFTLFEHFPNASVRLSQLCIRETEGFQNDTLLFAQEGFIQFGIFDILSKNFELNRVILLNTKINLKYNNKGKSNFRIFDKKKGTKILMLEKIILLNSRFSYINPNKLINIDAATKKLILKIAVDGRTFIDIKGNLFSKQLKVGNTNYLNQKNLLIESTLLHEYDTLNIIQSKLSIEDIKTTINGRISGNFVHLNIDAQEQNIASIITHMPERFQKGCRNFIANGIINSSSVIKGIISKEHNPSFSMEYDITKGHFKLKQIPFLLKSVRFSGTINNGEQHNFEQTEIKVKDFVANTENGSIKGKFSVFNFNKHYLIGDFISNWDLAEVNHYVEHTPFFNLQGKFYANTHYKGRFSFDTHFVDHFFNAVQQSSTTLKNVTFYYKNSPLLFSINTADCVFDNNIVEIKTSHSTIADSDLDFTGTITDLLPCIFDEKTNSITVDGDLKSTYIKFDELIQLKDISTEKSATTLPTWINANLNASIENFSFDNYVASTISGKLEYVNQTLSAKGFQMKTLNGDVQADAKWYESPTHHLQLFADMNIQKINIRNAFSTFNNFGQTFIQEQHLKGIGTAQVQLKASWNPHFIFDENKLSVKSHLIIEKGQLLNFKPLQNLSDYVSVEDLKDVTFSTLENTIEIDNNIITIPTMEIKSSALSVYVSGTHTFNQDIDYQIKLLLSELLSNKFRMKNTNISEFGEIEQDNAGFSTIYLKMTGNTDNPQINFDKIRIKENINKGIVKEKDIISNLIKEDILQNKGREEKQENDIIFEWDDEK